MRERVSYVELVGSESEYEWVAKRVKESKRGAIY